MESDQSDRSTAEKFMLRFDQKGMREFFKEVAAKNRRSMNAEINARLEQSIQAEKKNA